MPVSRTGGSGHGHRSWRRVFCFGSGASDCGSQRLRLGGCQAGSAIGPGARSSVCETTGRAAGTLGVFSQQAHNLILLSEDEARMLGRASVEPEHRLPALIRHGTVVSADLGQETSRRAKAGPAIHRAACGGSYTPPKKSGCLGPTVTTTGGSTWPLASSWRIPLAEVVKRPPVVRGPAWPRRSSRGGRQLPSGYPPRCKTRGCQGSSRGGGTCARHPLAGGSKPANSGDPSPVPSPAIASAAACSSTTQLLP